jgi:ribonuclease T2
MCVVVGVVMPGFLKAFGFFGTLTNQADAAARVRVRGSRRWSGATALFGLMAFLVAFLGAVQGGPAAAQDRRQNAPGEFDFYVLSLSWSPSFCEAASERGNSSRGSSDPVRGSAVLLRRAWAVAAIRARLPRTIASVHRRGSIAMSMASMLDLMPAPGLIYSEWDKHGTCSGMGARGIFRNHPQGARGGEDSGRVSRTLQRQRRLRREAIEEAFIKANPGLEDSACCRDLRQQAPQRSAHLHDQGSAVPRLRRDRPPRLPSRQGGDAAGARRVSCSVFAPRPVFRLARRRLSKAMS